MAARKTKSTNTTETTLKTFRLHAFTGDNKLKFLAVQAERYELLEGYHCFYNGDVLAHVADSASWSAVTTVG